MWISRAWFSGQSGCDNIPAPSLCTVIAIFQRRGILIEINISMYKMTSACATQCGYFLHYSCASYSICLRLHTQLRSRTLQSLNLNKNAAVAERRTEIQMNVNYERRRLGCRKCVDSIYVLKFLHSLHNEFITNVWQQVHNF